MATKGLHRKKSVQQDSEQGGSRQAHGAARASSRQAGGSSREKEPGSGSDLTQQDILKMPPSAYMNAAQQDFFRRRLLIMRQEAVGRQVANRRELADTNAVVADPSDRATLEEERWLNMRLREREVMLISKIDAALKRIHDGDYGYCERTGDPIGLPRLLARPTATVCVDVKDRAEQVESHYAGNV